MMAFVKSFAVTVYMSMNNVMTIIYSMVMVVVLIVMSKISLSA